MGVSPKSAIQATAILPRLHKFWGELVFDDSFVGTRICGMRLRLPLAKRQYIAGKRKREHDTTASHSRRSFNCNGMAYCFTRAEPTRSDRALNSAGVMPSPSSSSLYFSPANGSISKMYGPVCLTVLMS